MKSGKTTPRQKRAAATPGAGLPKRKAQTRARSTAPGATNGETALSLDERRRMIELAAYLRAERRGFAGGTPEQDWFEAEAEVDRMLAGSPQH